MFEIRILHAYRYYPMKLKQSILAIGLLMTGLFTACEKDKNTISGSFSMKVNDTLITVSRQLTATLHDTGKVNSYLVISGLSAQNQAITVNVIFPDRQLKAGTYQLTPTLLNSIGWAKAGLSDVYSADDVTKGATATIILEAVSETKAKGTFSGIIISDFDPSMKKTVTEGKFDVSVLSLK